MIWKTLLIISTIVVGIQFVVLWKLTEKLWSQSNFLLYTILIYAICLLALIIFFFYKSDFSLWYHFWEIIANKNIYTLLIVSILCTVTNAILSAIWIYESKDTVFFSMLWLCVPILVIIFTRMFFWTLKYNTYTIISWLLIIMWWVLLTLKG